MLVYFQCYFHLFKMGGGRIYLKNEGSKIVWLCLQLLIALERRFASSSSS